VELRGEDLSYYTSITFDPLVYENVCMITCSLPTKRRPLYQRYRSEKHLSEFYPQDGGESQLALKLRHCQPMYVRMSRCQASFTAHELNRTDLNRSTQLLQALTSHSHSTWRITSTYFEVELTGCRHSELGRIVRKLQFVARCDTPVGIHRVTVT